MVRLPKRLADTGTSRRRQNGFWRSTWQAWVHVRCEVPNPLDIYEANGETPLMVAIYHSMCRVNQTYHTYESSSGTIAGGRYLISSYCHFRCFLPYRCVSTYVTGAEVVAQLVCWAESVVEYTSVYSAALFAWISENELP